MNTYASNMTKRQISEGYVLIFKKKQTLFLFYCYYFVKKIVKYDLQQPLCSSNEGKAHCLNATLAVRRHLLTLRGTKTEKQPLCLSLFFSSL